MTSSTHLSAMFSLGWSHGRTPWEIGNCDFLFSLEQFQEGIRKKVHVEAIFCTWITEKKKTQIHYRRKNSLWLQSSSFDNTLNMNLTCYANTNPAVLVEDFTPESIPHRFFLISWFLWKGMVWSSLRPSINQIALCISFKYTNWGRWLQRLNTAEPEN